MTVKFPMIFVISAFTIIFCVMIGVAITLNVQTNATKDYCESKGMEYVNNNYCADGENAIEIETKVSGFGFIKLDYSFYIVN